MKPDIAFGFFIIVRHGINIRMAFGIQQIVADKAKNISVGNLYMMFIWKYFRAF